MSLACSSVQPVPALFSVKIPASLNANNSPLLATWVFVQASPEGSTGRSEFHDVSDRFTELMVPCVVVTNMRLLVMSISKSVTSLSFSVFCISKRSMMFGDD